MKYFGLILELKDDPDVIARYKEYHAHPWLEPLEGAKEVCVIDMKIFLLGTRMFMFMTAVDDFEPEREVVETRGGTTVADLVKCAEEWVRKNPAYVLNKADCRHFAHAAYDELKQ